MTRSSKSAHGQSLVEFALIVPIFILVLVGLFDMGRAVFAYSTLNNAAREAGRHAIVDQTVSDIQDRAAEIAGVIGTESGDVLVDFRLQTSPNVVGSCNANVGSSKVYGCLAVVRVTHSFTAATPLIGSLIGTIPMQGEVRFPVEHPCVDSGSVDCPRGE